MVPTITVALAATNDLDMMNNWLNVLQSVQLPFALLPVLHFTSSERIMKEFKNGRWVFVIYTKQKNNGSDMKYDL